MVANLQVGHRDLPELQLNCRQQTSALEGELYTLCLAEASPLLKSCHLQARLPSLQEFPNLELAVLVKPGS